MTFGRVSLVCILMIAGFLEQISSDFLDSDFLGALMKCTNSIIWLIDITKNNDCVKDFKDLAKNCRMDNFSFTPANSSGTPYVIPFTNYCGAHNTSKGGELGYCKITDQCCKGHDGCNDRIAPGETKYGITNNGYFTSFNCRCDDAFRNCLKSGNTLFGQLIGFAYFTLRHGKCFKEDYPQECKKNETFVCAKLCGEYSSDITKNKTVQFVDEKGWEFSLTSLKDTNFINGNC